MALPTRPRPAHRAALAALAGLAAPALADAAAPPMPPDPLPLSWCLERAAQASPELAVARAEADAARARVYPAGALPDPRFRYELSNVPVGELDLRSTPLSGQQLGLLQALPFPGRLGSERDAAAAAADASAGEHDDAVLRVAAAVERAWVELGFAQRAEDVTARNVKLLRQLAEVAESKYRVGQGLQQDVIRAQVALTELLDEQLRRRAAVETAASRLVALLDLPPETHFPPTAPLRDAAPLPDLAPLLERLETTSPRLRALAERSEAAEHRARAAELEGYPDVDLGLGYRVRRNVDGDPVDGEDFLGASVTVRLPLDRHKWDERAAEQEALSRRARAAWRRERAALAESLRAHHADLARADREIALLEEGLLPQARQSLASSRSGYEVDKVDFLSVIDSQVRLLGAQLRLERAVADRRAAFAALEAVLGEALR